MEAALRCTRVRLLQPHEQRSLPVSAQRVLGRSGGVLRVPHSSVQPGAEEPCSLKIRWKEKASLLGGPNPRIPQGPKPKDSVALCLNSPHPEGLKLLGRTDVSSLPCFQNQTWWWLRG